jgi:hypothetical protein
MLCETEEGDGMSEMFHYNFHKTYNKKLPHSKLIL